MFASRPAARIALLYIAVAFPWVLLTDALVRAFSPSDEIASLVESTKGAGFVIVTSGALYLLLRRQFGELMAARDEAESHDRFLQTLIGSLDDVVFAFDRDLTITFLAGPKVPAGDASVGHTAAELFGDGVGTEYMDAGRRVLAGEHVSVDWFSEVVAAQGVVVAPGVTALRIAMSPLFDADGEIVGGVGVGRDVSQIRDLERERAMAEDRLSFVVNYDELTGLPNRSLMEIRLNEAITMADRRGELVALHYLDLDNFKDVNDSLGHDAGDVVLQSVASRLRRLVRRSDTVARMGGDEFALIQTRFVDRSEAADLAKRVAAAMREPFRIGGQEVYVSASAGIAIFAADGTSAQDLYRSADTAMYAAKETPEQAWTFFAPEMATAARERLELGTELQRALEQDEIEIALQPVVRTSDSRIVAFEALARWNHVERGAISPMVFVPLAEAMGVVHRLDTSVHRQALQWLRRCRERRFSEVVLHLNISSVYLRMGGVEALRSEVAELEIPPEQIVVEVTESELLDPLGVGLTTLHELRTAGFQLAVDDFGTGYSSLSYLKQLPVTMLKIDTSFIADTSDEKGRALVETTAELGARLGYTVVQEGVETEEQRAFVVECGVQAWQGFLRSVPVTGDEALAMLAADRVDSGC